MHTNLLVMDSTKVITQSIHKCACIYTHIDTYIYKYNTYICVYIYIACIYTHIDTYIYEYNTYICVYIYI